MLNMLFRDHPAELGESYGEHLRAALGFGFRMIGGGIACLIHGLVPALCTTTGSRVVKTLAEEMVAKRAEVRDAKNDAQAIEWMI